MALDPGRLTTTTKAARNARIAASRAQGEAWKTIASREGLSTKQAARAAREHLEASVPAPVANPIDLAAFVIETHLDSLRTLRRLSGSRNQPTAVAAASRAPGVALSLLDVSTRLGLAPAPVASWQFLNDLPAIVRAFMAAADRAGVPTDLVLRELGVAVEEADAPELELAGSPKPNDGGRT